MIQYLDETEIWQTARFRITKAKVMVGQYWYCLPTAYLVYRKDSDASPERFYTLGDADDYVMNAIAADGSEPPVPDDQPSPKKPWCRLPAFLVAEEWNEGPGASRRSLLSAYSIESAEAWVAVACADGIRKQVIYPYSERLKRRLKAWCKRDREDRLPVRA